jgi:hypothetical protein
MNLTIEEARIIRRRRLREATLDFVNTGRRTVYEMQDIQKQLYSLEKKMLAALDNDVLRGSGGNDVRKLFRSISNLCDDYIRTARTRS